MVYNGAHDEHYWAERLCGLRTKKLTLVIDGRREKVRLDLLKTHPPPTYSLGILFHFLFHNQKGLRVFAAAVAVAVDFGVACLGPLFSVGIVGRCLVCNQVLGWGLTD